MKRQSICSLDLKTYRKNSETLTFALYTYTGQWTQVLLTNFTCSRFAYYDDSGGKKLRGLLWRFQSKDLSINETVWAWCCVCCQAHQGLTVWFLLLRYSVVWSVESLSLFYLLFISWFICTWRRVMGKLGIFHANQTYMFLDPHQNKGWCWYRETSLSPLVIFLITIPRWYFFCGSFLCVCLCYIVLSVSCSLVVTC